MDFSSFATDAKPQIKTHLLSYLETHSILSTMHPWGKDVQQRLSDVVTQGKMIRGILVLLGYRLFGGTEATAVPVASALELFHTSLLIHDDIMDQDSLRRGMKTISAQYQEHAATNTMIDPKRTGESLGICAGDLGFFLGFELVNTLDTTPELKQKLLKIISNELILVGLGQMQDIALGAKTAMPTEEEILTVYRYKTARYTFSLPLMLGALLAGADTKQLHLLELAGEALGLIFQIKDDELGIFGDEKMTGKPIGSDIREGKKTLYRLYLETTADTHTKQHLSTLFGKKHLTDEDLTLIRTRINEKKIPEKITSRVQSLAADFHSACRELEIAEPQKKLLDSLYFFITKRNS
jgi:geranylgeranyl diphosphate synthase type I